jgi:hypothetical protein
MIATHSSQYLSPRQDISIGLGNAIQALGFGVGLALLLVQAQPGFVIAPDLGFLMAYLMIVFTSYASAQYGLGRLLGIRFSHYSVGGSMQNGNTFSLMHLAAHPDPRSWAQTGPLARGLFAISGALASTALSLGMAALAANAGLWIGPVLVAANVLWFVFVIARQFRHAAHLR